MKDGVYSQGIGIVRLSRCAFSRIIGIFSMILPYYPLSHMNRHVVFGGGRVNSFENLPFLLGKFTVGRPHRNQIERLIVRNRQLVKELSTIVEKR